MEYNTTIPQNYMDLLVQRPLGWEYNGHSGMSSFEFEKFDPFYWARVMSTNWKWAYYAGVLYVFIIFSLKTHLKGRQGFKLKWPLFLWNLSLGVFSIFGFFRTAPGLVYTLQQPNGFYSSLCHKKYMDIPTMFWMFQFGFSKFLELGDTIFIVLRRRPLVFLQWYHHVSTMIVVWTLSPTFEPIGRYFFVLNYGVHSLMYPYFALRAIGVKIPSKLANVITTLQFLQMIVGFMLNITSMYYYYTREDCIRYTESINTFIALYGSFMVLFGKLFYDSVVLQKGRSKTIKLN